MKFCNSIIDTIGNTPLVKLNSVNKGIKGTILVKLEYFNPGNSMKDRIAEATSRFYPADDTHQDYYRKNPIRYKAYRCGCGRDKRLKKIWGQATSHAPDESDHP